MSLLFIDPATLKEHPDNPRSIRDERFEHLCHTLNARPEMLEARPLVEDVETGYVVCGNMRLRASRAILKRDPRGKLGEWVAARGGVPVYRKRFASAAERREWTTLDNQGFGEWVPVELAALVKEQADDDGADLALLGFAQPEIDGLLALIREPDVSGNPDADPEAAPPLPHEPVTQLGDLWIMGEHRLVCGDAEDAWLGVLGEGERCDDIGAVLTDPPYGIEHDTDYSRHGNGKAIGQGHAYRPVGGDDRLSLGEALNVLHYFDSVAEWFLFGADYYLDLLPRHPMNAEGFPGAWMVWDKRTESNDDGFGSGFELIASRQRHQRRMLRHLWFGMFGGEGGEARARMHPTQKPVALLRDILDRWAPDGALVADPFAGSGSTLIACEQTGRRARLVEIDAAYCDVIVQRWQDFTGREAERIAA